MILDKKMVCPRGAVWISFDDGWKDNLYNVIPIIKRGDIPITIFIPTGPIEEGTFWWTKVKSFPKDVPSEFASVEKLKKIDEGKRQEILQLIDNSRPYRNDRVTMTIQDIQTISKMPQITIGSHTVNHPILINCTSNQLDYELRISKSKLEEWIGKKVTTFSYPNGDFDGREKDMLIKYGYKMAAIETKFVSPDDRNFFDADNNPFLIPRNVVMDDGSLAENLCHIFGIWQPFINNIKKSIKKIQDISPWSV